MRGGGDGIAGESVDSFCELQGSRVGGRRFFMYLRISLSKRFMMVG